MALDQIHKILIVQLGGIGDTLLSVPFCAALRARWPKATVHLLAVQRVCSFMRPYNFIDQVIEFPLNPFSAFGVACSLRNKYDLAINMRTIVSSSGASRMRLLFHCIHPRISAGRNTDGRGAFFTVSIPEQDPATKHDSFYNRDLAVALGIPAYGEEIVFPPDQGASERIRGILHRVTGALVGVHPGGALSRRWPADYFVSALNKIHEEKSVTFVLTGSGDERLLVESIAHKIKAPVINCAGVLSVSELVALIKRCALFISNDTSVMHIAAVAGIPQIALIGPGDVTRFDPRVLSKKAVVLYTKADCSPCNKISCNDLKCLRSIPPEDVARQACILLGAYHD